VASTLAGVCTAQSTETHRRAQGTAPVATGTAVQRQPTETIETETIETETIETETIETKTMENLILASVPSFYFNSEDL